VNSEETPMDAPLHYASLVEVAALIAARDLSPVDLTERMLARIQAVNPALNAFLAVTGESALKQAETARAEIRAGRYRGPLHGVPIAIKDLFHTEGTPATFGTLAYKNFVADEDATVVRRLRVAGAVILGRLHLHEGAFGEHHPELGRCLNPWNAAYWPGGSSSGSGAATAVGMCFGSLGTDTGGSIRFPSAANGVTGLKPTWGRVSRAGAFPLAESLDTIGPMTRSAADAAAMFDVIAGADPRDPTSLPAPAPAYLGALEGARGARGFRIGFDEAYVETGVDAETIAALREALATFRDLGATITPVTVPPRAEATAAQMIITDTESARFHKAVYEADKSRFGPQLAGAMERGLAADPLALAGAYIERDRFKGEIARMFAGVDALISPIYPMVGARYDEMDDLLTDLPRFLGFTSPYNVSGSPSLTLPCGLSRVGMPLGMQLIGPHLSEAALLRAGHAFQQATYWHTRRPPNF
jgi:amidase